VKYSVEIHRTYHYVKFKKIRLFLFQENIEDYILYIKEVVI